MRKKQSTHFQNKQLNVVKKLGEFEAIYAQQKREAESMDFKLEKLKLIAATITEGQKWLMQRKDRSDPTFYKSVWYQDFAKRIQESCQQFDEHFPATAEIYALFPKRDRIHESLNEITEVIQNLQRSPHDAKPVNLFEKIKTFLYNLFKK